MVCTVLRFRTPGRQRRLQRLAWALRVWKSTGHHDRQDHYYYYNNNNHKAHIDHNFDQAANDHSQAHVHVHVHNDQAYIHYGG